MSEAVYKTASTDALVVAIENDDAASVERWLHEGADPNGVREMLTPLMRAAARKFDKAVVLLIDSGADIALENADGEDAKCVAASKGHVEIVNLITATCRKRDERIAAERALAEFRENIEGIVRACKGGTNGAVLVHKPLRLKGGGE